MADTTGTGAGAQPQPGQQQAAPQIRILTQYTKDLSFENPQGSRAADPKAGQPQIEVSVNVHAGKMGEDIYEVDLKIRVQAKREDKTAFLCELSYGGVFQLQNLPEDAIQPVLFVECARQLFPFARRVIADTVRDGGYPALLLDPIDFLQLYRRQVLAAQQQQQQQGGTAPQNA